MTMGSCSWVLVVLALHLSPSASDYISSPTQDQWLESTELASCSDKKTQCAGWAAKGWCETKPGYLNAYCKKTCGVCGGSSSTPATPVAQPTKSPTDATVTSGSSSCDGNTDRKGESWCVRMGSGKGWCTSKAVYMKSNCAKTCCASGTPATPVAQPTKSPTDAPTVPPTDAPVTSGSSSCDGNTDKKGESWCVRMGTDKGWCTSKAVYMKSKCAKTCCASGTPATPVAATRSPVRTPTKQPVRVPTPTPPSSSSSSSGCAADKTTRCAEYQKSGYCKPSHKFYKSYMVTNCATTCCGTSSAGSSSSSSSAGCKDKHGRCAEYKGQGMCDPLHEFKDFMLEKCAKTCGTCGLVPTQAPTLRESERKCIALSTSTAAKETAVNVIMVPSGFNGDMVKWKTEAQRSFNDFKNHRPLNADEIEGLNVFYVEAESDHDDGKQCNFGSAGVDRLLACKDWVFEGLADQHCGAGLSKTVLIIHNDDKYGGSGSKNVCTSSINIKSPRIAIHELGHSLFGLADEYSSETAPTSAPAAPNCQVAGCPDFADLKNAPGGWWQEKSFSNIQCVPGCKDGSAASFVGRKSMMGFMTLPFGAANERITCCKYLFHGFTPPYCADFDKNSLNLREYCTDKVWKGKTPVALELVEVGSQDHLKARAEDPMGVTSVYVASPVEWLAEAGPDGEWVCEETDKTMKPGLYPTEAVHGEQGDGQDQGATWLTNAEADDGDDRTVIVLDQNNQLLRTLKFHAEEALEVPPADSGDNSAVKLPRQNFQLILNSGETCTIAVTSDQIDGSWSEDEDGFNIEGSGAWSEDEDPELS